MPNYTVQQGDTISSIAFQYGLWWRTIWDHPNNSALRQRRGNQNILYPGDEIFVPDLREKQYPRSTDRRHRFRRKGVPAMLRLRLVEHQSQEQDQGQDDPVQESGDRSATMGSGSTSSGSGSTNLRARAGVPYVLEVEGRRIQGSSDGDGIIECNIPPCATRGRLIIEPGTANELSYPLHIGHLNPASETSGIKQRLSNLGFPCGDWTEESSPELEAALRAFQQKYGLNVTGQVDEDTRNRLNELHRS